MPHRPSTLAAIACSLEAIARKPGNVHRGRDFEGLHLLDLLLAGSAIGPGLDLAASAGVGRAILDCVEATGRVSQTNPNLGIILLLAPLAAVPPDISLRDGVGPVLASLGVEDARLVYRAIRLAEPGGMGTVEDQNINDEPTVTLVEAMRLAADRDMIACQYTNQFAEVFDAAASQIAGTLEAGRTLEEAIIAASLTILSRHPDSLIARKRGNGEAVEASRSASKILAAGWPGSKESELLLLAFDRWLRAAGHGRNPGTTADLVTAGLYVALRDETITLPRDWGMEFRTDLNVLFLS